MLCNKHMPVSIDVCYHLMAAYNFLCSLLKQTRLGLGTNELLEMLTAREQSCNPWKRPNLLEKWDTDEATKWGMQDGEGQRCTKQSWPLKALGTLCPSREKGRRSELKWRFLKCRRGKMKKMRCLILSVDGRGWQRLGEWKSLSGTCLRQSTEIHTSDHPANQRPNRIMGICSPLNRCILTLASGSCQVFGWSQNPGLCPRLRHVKNA